MAITMTKDEMNNFLKEPWLTSVATVTPEGFPHVTPIWSYYDGEHFYMTLVDGNPKSRSLALNNHIALAIGNDTLPYKAVIVHGTVELLREDVEPIVRKLVEKYVGGEQADAIIEYAFGEPQVIAKVTPWRIYTWDQSKVDFPEVLKAEKSGKAFRVPL